MNRYALQRFVAVLSRRTWLFTVAVVLTCTALAASAVSALVDGAYLAPSTTIPPIPASVTPHVAAPTRRGPDGRDFVARDMFCSTCTPPIDVAGPNDTFTPAAVLIATVIGDESRCTVRALESGAQGSYGIGDSIQGVGRITRIGWRSVEIVDSDGHHGHLDLLDTLAAARGDAGAATPDPAAAAEPWAGRIKKIDDHTFEVDRELVRDMVSGATKPGGARIMPVSGKDGKLSGLRMLGVKDASLAGALGLKNGDVMSAINNTPITSMQVLMDVYGNIDSLNVVEISGTRADKPLGITLRLR
jgi:general secretion pathway protein C